MIRSYRPPLRQLSRNSRRCVAPASSRWYSVTGANGRQWSTPLAKSLGEAITTTGPIPVASYMRQCLTSPDGGYYTSQREGRDQFGGKGDFTTSPEISQVFGELVGLWIVAEWMSQGKTNTGVNIIETGPGRGTLMNDLLRTIANFKPLAEALDTVYLVEASPHLRETQRKLLCDENAFEEIEIGFKSTSKFRKGLKIVWCEDMKFVPKDDNSTPFIVAHEFFDALPIHVFQSVASSGSNTITPINQTFSPSRTSNEWRELLVALASPYSTQTDLKTLHTSELAEFTLVTSKMPTRHSKLLPSISNRYSELLAHTGATIEISPESLATIADFAIRIGGPNPSSPQTGLHRTKTPSGAALILDYGPLDTIPTNSLRGIRAHRPVSPFSNPGLVDVSADVDFIGLAYSALDASPGVEVHGPVEQANFLWSMGIKERAEMLEKTARERSNKEGVERMEGAWKRLVDRGPSGMGRIYKAMAILPHQEGSVRRPVGFGGDITL